MPPKQCVRGAQCKRPQKEHIICCIGSAFPELVRLQQEYADGLPASDPPLPGKQEPRSAKLSELKEDALRRATCLSGASGQRCEFHASCEDERRDAHKSFDKHIIKVHKCREPQGYTVKDSELGGEERLVPSHESHVYHRAYIKRTLDHLLCKPCWETHARDSGLQLVAYPPGASDPGAQQDLAEKRELSHASKKARTGVHYLVQSTCDDGNGQHAAIIRSTHRGSQLDMDELTRDLLQQHDPTWEQDIMPMMGRFQRATQLRRAPRQQRSSTFAHAPPARQGAASTSNAPPCPAAPRAPAPNPIRASMLGQQASGSLIGAVPQPTPLAGTVGAPHQHVAAHATGLVPSGPGGSAGASQHTGAVPQPTPLAGTVGAPHQHVAAHTTGLVPSGPGGSAGAVPQPTPLAGTVGAPHQHVAAHATGLVPSGPGGSAGAVPQPAPLSGVAAALHQLTAHAAGLASSGLGGLTHPFQHTGMLGLPGVPNQNVPPYQPAPDGYACAIGNSFMNCNPLRKDTFKHDAPIPNFYQLQQVPPSVPNHMDGRYFINEGIISAMCGLVEDISGGIMSCLNPDWLDKLRKGERILERVPPNWQFICLPFLSNLNWDGGDVFVPVWRMLVVDRKIQAVQIYCPHRQHGHLSSEIHIPYPAWRNN